MYLMNKKQIDQIHELNKSYGTYGLDNSTHGLQTSISGEGDGPLKPSKPVKRNIHKENGIIPSQRGLQTMNQGLYSVNLKSSQLNIKNNATANQEIFIHRFDIDISPCKFPYY
jgi:hypothetical protein